MSVPPPPNQWGSQPPPSGQPAGGPQWGSPPGGPPGGAPQWGPQQPWGRPPGPPPRGGKGKWILAGIAVLAVIAVTVVITVLVVGKESGGGESPTPTPTNGNSSDFASANDKGPVGIITDDPTCDTWRRINDAVAADEKGVSWPDRDQSVPATAWNPQQRTMYEAVSKALRTADDQVVEIVKLTPHRVMRELYEQFIAYSRAFVESFPSYSANEKDRGLAFAPDNLGLSLTGVCSAIVSGSAGPIAPLVPAAAAPTKTSPPGDAADPSRFLATPNPVCTEWTPALDKFFDDMTAWRQIDANTPATAWTPDEKAVNDAAMPKMTVFADDLEELGRRSANPTLEDFAVLSAQYWRATVKALPTYTSADVYLANAANYSAYVVQGACNAAG